VTEIDLERALKRLDLATVSRQFREKEIFPVSPEAMARVRQEFRRIFALYSNNGSKPMHTQQERSLADHLLDRLLVSLSGSNNNHFKIRRRKRENAIAQAEKYINNHGHQPISVVSLSKAAGVSKRTLQYSFQERFGVSPLQYLKAFRLRMVRRELVDACPSKASVSDLAGKVGFGHLGQFAADYKRHFGELPSHTLLLRG
jgi:AraC family ethanolamine operon transcriptional activator